ncbi:hypothetical protein AB0P15_19910 [Streptomyces sp. NPDC087917]|uniref:hypothetical protein n=1 Tax=unclassified Streptomyces TaxID=2593676 RepID=UPI003422CF76
MTADPRPELDRIESDPAYRAVFLALLDAGLADRAAAGRNPAAEAAAVTLGAVAWVGCVTYLLARGWGA